MIDEIFYNQQTIYNIIDIRTHDDYTFAHSVNVGILAILTGSALNYNRGKLEILGIGAVLHDIGKIFIPSAILNKPGKLEPNEYEIIKEHTSSGYQLLKEENISYVASHIAYEHHEREDGSGYPRGLTAWKIHNYAKIVAVADTFDAMTTNRVYKKALPTHLALKELEDLSGIKYSKPIVDCFKKMIASYPLGSILKLVNGEIVTVIKATKNECIVKTVSNEGSREMFDLYHFPDLTVVEVIK
jgi:putative nucleotidyltransferase with HDIG domain